MEDFDALFGAAEEDLKKQEVPDEWGELRQPAEGERVLGRYLGEGVMPPFNDVVYRFVDYPGEPRPFYLKYRAQLGLVMEEKAPAIGDIVGLVRGRDKDTGKPNLMETWSGWSRPYNEPPAGELAVPTPSGGGGGQSGEIPFEPV
jgi:hypothetical protein